MLYLAGKTEETSERLLWRGKEGARIYKSFCKKDQVVKTPKEYCLIKENQIPQVNKFSIFLYMGIC